jgi:hypothetical protein
MAKITGKYLENFVNEALDKILAEVEDSQTQADDTNNNNGVESNEIAKFIDDERNDLSNSIVNDNKVMATLQNPMERNLKQKQININKAKVKNLAKIQNDLKKAKEMEKKQPQNQQITTQVQPQTTQQTQSQVGQGLNVSVQEHERMPVLKRNINEQIPAPLPAPVAPKKKVVYNVAFDTKGKQPFNVKFSERGFDINGTRLSFELLETAISKNFSIVLDAGQGLTLDSVRMQKILRYKDRFQ